MSGGVATINTAQKSQKRSTARPIAKTTPASMNWLLSLVVEESASTRIGSSPVSRSRGGVGNSSLPRCSQLSS